MRTLASNKYFIVSLHDVAPCAEAAVARMLEQLAPRAGVSISAAVVPAAFHQQNNERLVHSIRERCREIVLHGFSHTGAHDFHPLTLLTENANEFSRLSAAQASERLRKGQEWMCRVFGAPALIFIPPAWQLGPVNLSIALEHGLEGISTISQFITFADNVPIAPYSWDCGRFAALGYLGEAFGFFRQLFFEAVPIVVLHPRDLDRGFFPRSLKVIDRLLRQGYEPVTFAQVLEEMQLAARDRRIVNA